MDVPEMLFIIRYHNSRLKEEELAFILYLLSLLRVIWAGPGSS